MSEILTDVEVAALLRVKPVTIRNLHRVGVLRGILVGRHLRWLATDVEAYIASLKGEVRR